MCKDQCHGCNATEEEIWEIFLGVWGSSWSIEDERKIDNDRELRTGLLKLDRQRRRDRES
jgi:hypothetical protein